MRERGKVRREMSVVLRKPPSQSKKGGEYIIANYTNSTCTFPRKATLQGKAKGCLLYNAHFEPYSVSNKHSQHK